MMKKALVIGASSGIGRELAKILAQNGYGIGVMARRLHLLNELREEIKGELYIREVDVADAETAIGTLENFINEMGGADLVVISAGTGNINNDLDWRLEEETIKTNVTGFAALANVVMHHFMERGSGHLIGISSIAALRGGRESPAYNASKAFQSNYMEGLRQKNEPPRSKLRGIIKLSICLLVIPACRESFRKERFWTSQNDRGYGNPVASYRELSS